MLNFNSLLLFSENPKKLSDFYSKVFEKQPDWTEGDYYGWQVGSGFLTVGPHDKVKGINLSPERMMFNFETQDVKTEFDRLKSLGAAVIQEPYQPGEEPTMWIATFSDPEGNFFQVMTPMPTN
ncbi:MAG: hypothetical protein ACD_24C00546G0004 [uncultured bacterium]|nr:MAG: hypothetical protein ACD_24C00546G0004 [uncultured bacterium]